MSCNQQPMDPCNPCTEGCLEFVSGKCVQYTGEDTAYLGIPNGLNLNDVIVGIDQALYELQVEMEDNDKQELRYDPSDGRLDITGGNHVFITSSGTSEIPSLQQVTDKGNITTKPLIVSNSISGVTEPSTENSIKLASTAWVTDKLNNLPVPTIPTLQTVTTQGNVTDRGMYITGSNGIIAGVDGMFIGNFPGTSTLTTFNGSTQIHGITLKNSETTFAFGITNSQVVRFQLLDPDNITVDNPNQVVGKFYGRVQGEDAVNPLEFITKQQLDSATGSQTLQDVTTLGNSTSTGILITGSNTPYPGGESLYIGNSGKDATIETDFYLKIKTARTLLESTENITALTPNTIELDGGSVKLTNIPNAQILSTDSNGVIQAGTVSIGDLQSVTDVGNTTSNDILISNDLAGATLSVDSTAGDGTVQAMGINVGTLSVAESTSNSSVYVQARFGFPQIEFAPGTGAKNWIIRGDADLEFFDNRGGTITNTLFVDGRMSGANATNSNEFVTKQQLDSKPELDPVWTDSSNEQIVTTTGIISNLVLTSNLLRFTGVGTTLTGIAVPTTRAKSIVIINDSGSDINIQHLNTTEGVRGINILGNGLVAGDNVPLSAGSAIKLDYSNTKWKVSNWWGDGYSPNLRGAGTRVVEVFPNGKTNAVESFEMKIFRPDITTTQTDSDLNTLYPLAMKGVEIYCRNITGGGIVYIKDDDSLNTWVKIPLLN